MAWLAEACGARRKLWVRLPNAAFHCDDSASSLAASWLSGETTRDWTLAGSSGDHTVLLAVVG